MKVPVLGISAYFHDSSASLIIDDQIIASAEEERFSRKKHDNRFPKRAIDFCLSAGGLMPADVPLIAFYEKPYLKCDRILKTLRDGFPFTFRQFQKSLRSFPKKDLRIDDDLKRHFGINKSTIRYVPHHFSHAAGAFWTSGFKDSAILTIDGVGEFATATVSQGIASRIVPLLEMKFPESIGLLYSVFTAFCGFQINEGEYKLMGMSSYGSPKWKEKIYRMVQIFDDGSIHIDKSFINYHLDPTKPFTRKFIKVFGLPRLESTDFNLENNSEDQRFADIASSIQDVVEEIVLKMAVHAKKVAKSENLCLSGGVALNGKANDRIRREAGFTNLFVQPAAGDSGTSLGAALALKMTLEDPESSKSAWIGKSYNPYSGYQNDSEDVASFFKLHEPRSQKFLKYPDLVGAVAQRLADGQVGGWVRGRAEFGPRALGNRSILANPSRSKMKDIVNEKVKFRELFRPFAPSALDFFAEQAFEIGPLQLNDPLEFMLQVVKVRPNYRKKLAAITHVDGTARLQVVTRKRNSEYYELIHAFGKLTGTYCLLNTSFNLKGEPIVNTHLDAYKTYLECGLDFLVCENTMIWK